MRWYKSFTYHLLHTGGFLRLCTERGRVYWLAQNETIHTTPDWKIHFSIAPRGEWGEDIGVAWDILAALFMERCCEVGMKARYDSWQDQGQRGREGVDIHCSTPQRDSVSIIIIAIFNIAFDLGFFFCYDRNHNYDNGSSTSAAE